VVAPEYRQTVTAAHGAMMDVRTSRTVRPSPTAPRRNNSNGGNTSCAPFASLPPARPIPANVLPLAGWPGDTTNFSFRGLQHPPLDRPSQFESVDQPVSTATRAEQQQSMCVRTYVRRQAGGGTSYHRTDLVRPSVRPSALLHVPPPPPPSHSVIERPAVDWNSSPTGTSGSSLPEGKTPRHAVSDPPRSPPICTDASRSCIVTDGRHGCNARRRHVRVRAHKLRLSGEAHTDGMHGVHVFCLCRAVLAEIHVNSDGTAQGRLVGRYLS